MKEERAIQKLWVQAEEEIAQEDTNDDVRASRQQQARIDRHGMLVQKRQMIRARVLGLSSQQQGVAPRLMSGVPKQFMIPESRKRVATEEAQYKLGIDVIGLLDDLDRIAPGKIGSDDKPKRPRGLGLPPRLPPEPILETDNYRSY